MRNLNQNFSPLNQPYERYLRQVFWFQTYYDILLVNKQKREMNVIKEKASHNVRMANEFDMHLNSWLDPGNNFLGAISALLILSNIDF